jgi:hypothetical protein
MDINRKQKSSLGNQSKLKNAANDKVAGIKTSVLRKNKKPITADAGASSGENE